MDVTIEARLNNIEKEQEGVFQSTILFFPTTMEDVQAALRRIEVDGVNYKKVMLSDVNIDAQHVFYPVWEAKHIDELNYLAHRLNELTEADLTVFMAVVECSERPLSAKDMINISMNLDCYEYSFGVSDDWELGRRLAEDDERLYFPPDVEKYVTIDYEGYARDIREQSHGRFTEVGYLEQVSAEFIEHYHGPLDIPREQRVFAYPQLTIREQLAAFQMQAAKDAEKRQTPPPAHAHNER